MSLPSVIFCGPSRSARSKSFANFLRASAVVHIGGTALAFYSIVGIEKAAPSLMPEGQRAVTVLVRV